MMFLFLACFCQLSYLEQVSACFPRKLNRNIEMVTALESLQARYFRDASRLAFSKDTGGVPREALY